jgi:hypothetical protein
MAGGKLRVGVLGVGRIGKIHSENLATRIPGAELAILGDIFLKGIKNCRDET